MFTNKHVIIAMLVAPLLAILAWFGIDAMVGEQSAPPAAGSSYKLIQKPNCRWPSGKCGMKNGTFELTLIAARIDQSLLEIRLNSSHPLVGVQISTVTTPGEASAPVAMHAQNQQNRDWWLHIPSIDPGLTRFRLVAKADESVYYGEVSTIFLQSPDQPEK